MNRMIRYDKIECGDAYVFSGINRKGVLSYEEYGFGKRSGWEGLHYIRMTYKVSHPQFALLTDSI